MTTMNHFQPLADRTIIKRDAPDDTSEGGILIPDGAKEKLQTGIVMAIGPEVKDVSVGDRIIFQAYGFTPIEVDKQEMLVICEEEIMIRIKQDEQGNKKADSPESDSEEG